MIEIHTHILPMVDDGSQSMDESIEMARFAAGQGIHTIIATPHYINFGLKNNKVAVIEKVSELNNKLQEANIPVTILPGQEIRIYGELIQDYKNGELLSLNDKGIYILIELPSTHIPKYTEELMFQLQTEGVIPIIAHPERNIAILENVELLYSLVDKGCLAQLTSSCITGEFGKSFQQCSFEIISKHLAHFISSDAHNNFDRPFRLAEAMSYIEKHFGIDMVQYFSENAKLLVMNKRISTMQPKWKSRKKFFQLFTNKKH